MQKLAFYAARGARAVLHVDRETRANSLFRLTDGRLDPVPPDGDGLVTVTALGISFRRVVDEGALRLEILCTRTGKSLVIA